MVKNITSETKVGFFTLFTNYADLCRFCLAVVFTLSLLVFAFWLVVSFIGPSQKFSIAFNKEGATIISVNNEPSKALVLVSASQLWTNTGLNLKPNQSISIGATGRVNLAIHRLIDAADKDVRPRHGWVGPDGDQLKNEKPLDRIRKPLRIEQRVGFGCLLAYIKPEGEPDAGKENPIPTGIQVIGRNGNLTYLDPKGRVGTLFLTVNEAVLKDDAEHQAGYIGTQEILDETFGPKKITVDMQKTRWKQIVKDNYWEVWFDDNVGEFLVQISYEPIE
jgi:hypothetical protein